MHQLLRIVMKEKLHFAPIDKDRPVRILDIGAGTGIWAVEMGYFPISILLPLLVPNTKKDILVTDLARRPISPGRNSRNRSQPHAINLVGYVSRLQDLRVSTDCCKGYLQT